MTALPADQAVALASLVLGVLAAAICGYAGRRAASGPDGEYRRFMWSVAGLLALVMFPLLGSAAV